MQLLLLQNQQMIQQQQFMLMMAMSDRNNCCHHSHSHRVRSTSSTTVQTTDHGSSPFSTPLNNQSTPGLQSNNYYDNFKSNTRQNQLRAHTVPSTGVSPSTCSLLDQQQQQPIYSQAHIVWMIVMIQMVDRPLENDLMIDLPYCL